MKLVIISDTHNYHRNIKLPDGDVLIHCGDATMNGREQEIFDFLAWFRFVPGYKIKLFVPGNHDFDIDKHPDFWRNICAEYGIHLLIDDALEYEGVRFYGAPWVPNLIGWAFYGDEFCLNRKFEQIPEATNVLITHGPPDGIMDDCGIHVGSKELRNNLPRLAQLKIHCFGHIHEGYGTLKQGDLTFVNAAICTRSYMPTNEPIVIEI